MFGPIVILPVTVALLGASPAPPPKPAPVETLLRQVAAAPPWEQAGLARRALEAYPEHPTLLFLLGGALIFEGEWEDARSALDLALGRVPAEAGRLRASIQLNMAVLDGHLPDRREQARQQLEALLAGSDLTPGERLRARLSLVRALSAAGRLREADQHLQRAEADQAGVDLPAQDMVVAERAMLHLRTGALQQATHLLPRLEASSNRVAWWVGILARVFLDRPEGLKALLAAVALHELPGPTRLPAQALLLGVRRQPWSHLLEQQRARFPEDPSTPMLAAWLERHQGRPDWRRHLDEGVLRLGPAFLLRPPWAREES